MALVNITLTEKEQEFLLGIAGDPSVKLVIPVTARSIAGKIRRAQDTEEWTVPDMTPCGLCEAPRSTHDEPDHNWQWNVPAKALAGREIMRLANPSEAPRGH